MREIDVAIVGDIAWNHDITPQRKAKSPGGAAYYSAVGAARFSTDVGVVAKVGEDFDLNLLRRRQLDTMGVAVVPGQPTCEFVITQFSDNSRTFQANRGVSETVDTGIFPSSYLSARYVHLPTQLPEHSLAWLDFLKSHDSVSVDSFEAFVKQSPGLTLEMFRQASLIFTNEAEIQMLRQFGEVTVNKPMIIKRGSEGACYIDGTNTIMVPAPKVRAVETTGAGDVLAGAYLALRAQSVPIESALEQAAQTASLSVTEFGVEHIPTREFMHKKPELITAILIVNEKGQVFLGRAPKFNNALIAPGGHFNDGETPEECATREAKEEIGVNVTDLKFLKTHEAFTPEYKGRGARFICHNFSARITDSNITLARDEYSDYIFIEPKKALDLPDLHPTARKIIEYYLETSSRI
jgi:ribokinase